jgi:predicted nucleotide-binding protein (sugar kinase/HSP70/actin superfamily)
MKPIITFARWGNYTFAFQSLFEQLGLDVIPPEKTNQQTIAEGARMAPEMFCFPMKVTLGNYLPALKKGANTIFMVQNVGGSCRQRYYGAIQEKVLKETGHQINFLDFRAAPQDIYRTIKKTTGASVWQMIKAGRFFFRKLRLIEKMAQHLRPREAEKGKTDRLLTEIFSGMERINKEKDFSRLKKDSLRRLREIEVKKKKNLPRVGLIGEIYTVCDPTVNFEVERKLGLEGIEVYREMDITYHLKKLIFPWKDWTIQRKINPYLRSTVGGHGRDAIYEMLHYIKEDFDGVIHLLPAFCMPEITVRPILEKIHQESGIPFLSLSLDEQVAEAGINTRLEAFIDVVQSYHQNKNLGSVIWALTLALFQQSLF